MKDSRQWANEIEEKLNILYAARRRKRKRVLQATAVAACFFIVLACLFTLPDIFLAPINPPQTQENILMETTPAPTATPFFAEDNHDNPDSDNTKEYTEDAPTSEAGTATMQPSVTSPTTPVPAHRNVERDSASEENKKIASTKPDGNSTPVRPTEAPSSTTKPPSFDNFSTGSTPPPTATTSPATAPPTIVPGASLPQATGMPMITAPPTTTNSPVVPTEEPFFPAPGTPDDMPPGDVNAPGSEDNDIPSIETGTVELETYEILLDVLINTTI